MKGQRVQLYPSKWMVIVTHPHREAFAIENLERQGYEACCPMILRRIRHARRTYDAHRPLFPSYILMRMTRAHWRSVQGSYGVRSTLCDGDTPALLPSGFVENLKACELASVICKQEGRLKPGQVVASNGGRFGGLIGRIVQIRDRVVLLLDLLNQKGKVLVDASMLSPCHAAGPAAIGAARC